MLLVKLMMLFPRGERGSGELVLQEKLVDVFHTWNDP